MLFPATKLQPESAIGGDTDEDRVISTTIATDEANYFLFHFGLNSKSSISRFSTTEFLTTR